MGFDRRGNRDCRHEAGRDLCPSLTRDIVSGSANFAVPSCNEQSSYLVQPSHAFAVFKSKRKMTRSVAFMS